LDPDWCGSRRSIVPDPLQPTDHFRVPASEAASVRIEVTPQEIVGYASIPFELRDIDLKQYLAKPPPNRAGAR
jgi:hypothetical protein